MTPTCPGCGVALSVKAEGLAVVTCPVCLARVPVVGQSPPPIPAMKLDYFHSAGGNNEAEMQKDLHVAALAIAVFAAVAGGAFWWLSGPVGMRSWPAIRWAVTVTAGVAIFSIIQEAQRNHRARTRGVVRGTGRRVVTVVALGLGWVALFAAALVAIIVLLFAACVAIFSGMK